MFAFGMYFVHLKGIKPVQKSCHKFTLTNASFVKLNVFNRFRIQNLKVVWKFQWFIPLCLQTKKRKKIGVQREMTLCIYIFFNQK
jgi:hypothetical protein